MSTRVSPPVPAAWTSRHKAGELLPHTPTASRPHQAQGSKHTAPWGRAVVSLLDDVPRAQTPRAGMTKELVTALPESGQSSPMK